MQENPVRRELVGYCTNAHAGLIELIGDTVATTPFAGAIIEGAQQRAWEDGLLLLTVNTGGDKSLRPLWRSVLNGIRMHLHYACPPADRYAQLMSPDRYLSALATSLDRLIPLAYQSEEILTRSVPACPDWTLDELFGHLGSVERWVSEVLLEGKFVKEPAEAPPATAAAAWFLEGTNSFLGAMAALDPLAQCWNFGPPPHKAGFWLRRQAHEHAIHLVDACQASDLEIPVLEEDLMLDGIDEVLAMLTPRQLCLERMPLPEAAVTFHVPGADSWTIGQGPSKASITAPLHEMYVGLWGRADLEDTAIIEGDAALALRILQGPLTF